MLTICATGLTSRLHRMRAALRVSTRRSRNNLAARLAASLGAMRVLGDDVQQLVVKPREDRQQLEHADVVVLRDRQVAALEDAAHMEGRVVRCEP